MVISIKKVLIFIISIVFAVCATVFLSANFTLKAILSVLFIILNLIAFNDLFKINHIKQLLVDDFKTRLPISWEILGSVVVIIWSLQIAPGLSWVENIIWIPSNAICEISFFYVIYKLVRAFHEH